MTGKTKVWPVKSTISPDIVRWPAIISSPGFPNWTVKRKIQNQIFRRWNPVSDIAFDCKSEIRILKSKSRFPNRIHPLTFPLFWDTCSWFTLYHVLLAIRAFLDLSKNAWSIERRSMTSHHHGGAISGWQQNQWRRRQEENGKKVKVFYCQNDMKFAHASHLILYISLALLHSCDMKLPNFHFMESVNTTL